MIGNNDLVTAPRITPFLVTARLTGQQELVPFKNLDDLIRRQTRRAALTQS